MRAVAACLIVGAGKCATLAAQATIETGSGEAHLDRFPSGVVTSIAGNLGETFGKFRVEANGVNYQHRGLGSTSRAGGSLLYVLTADDWRFDAGPVVRAGRGVGEAWTRAIGGAVHVARNVGGLTVEAGWQQGIASLGGQHTGWEQRDISGHVLVGAVRLGTGLRVLTVHDSVSRDELFFKPSEVAAGGPSQRLRDVRDASIDMTWTVGPITFDGEAGRRFGSALTAQTFWHAAMMFHMAPALAVTANAGYAPADPLFGLRGGRYTMLGLRVEVPRRLHDDSRAGSRIVKKTPTGVLLRFTLPSSVRHATLSGDLTGWRPLELSRRSDGQWYAWVENRPGVYRVNIQIDEGMWLVPDGIPYVDDGFGGRVGILVL